MNITNICGNADFDWESLDPLLNKKTLTDNKKIKTNNGDRVYSFEKYAQEFYNQLVNSYLSSPVCVKEMSVNEIIPIYNIKHKTDNIISLELANGYMFDMDISKERKLLNALEITSQENPYSIESFMNFVDWYKKETKNDLSKKDIFQIKVIKGGTTPKLSWWDGYLDVVKKEMLEEIKNPKYIYLAKLVSVNHGGFNCELMNGMTAFMPGSLAAANVILDFESMVGSSVFFMGNNKTFH